MIEQGYYLDKKETLLKNSKKHRNDITIFYQIVMEAIYQIKYKKSHSYILRL